MNAAPKPPWMGSRRFPEKQPQRGNARGSEQIRLRCDFISMNSAQATFTPLANLCKSMGDPLRLEILRILKADSFNVMELCDIFDSRQSGMSHHLKVLANAGAVTTRREGNSIYYRRALSDTESVQGTLQQALLLQLDTVSPAPEIMARIDQIKHQRAETARAFFDRYVQEFQHQQTRIAPDAQYADAALQLLRKTPVPLPHRALEIGPGEGTFLTRLAEHFEKIIALDISSEMLQEAARRTQHLSAETVNFFHGDTQAALKQNIEVSHVVCNMVLHHVPSPADLFQDISQLLIPGGTLVLTDLCRHEQHWVRQACGDLWLGFDPEELGQWATCAGLNEQDSLYIGLRNGFQIQVRSFIKPATRSELNNHINPTTHSQQPVHHYRKQADE
jgi:ArsR family transcriptional regulator